MSTLLTTNLKNSSSGSNNIVLGTDGSTTIPTLSATNITGTTIQGTIKSGTAVASTSGTAIDFTGIPSWVKRVTVMLRGVSTNGSSIIQIQLGTTSGFITTGYLGSVDTTAAGTSAALFTTGLGLSRAGNAAAASVRHGIATFVSMGGNFWTGTQVNGGSDAAAVSIGGCSVDLAGTLTQLRITTVNGTDTFDAGTINLLWEG
jgi:hypothetical protein